MKCFEPTSSQPGGKAGDKMPYVSPQDILQAKQMDLLTYLQNYEPNELVRISANTYCTREHDSLKISNGKWNWFSRGFGGTTALDYLVRVKGYSFIQAVETILVRSAVVPPVTRQAPVKVKPRVLLLPEQNPTADRVVRYLRGRGIHPVIIDHCLRNRTLYESAKYHSAVFVGRDKEGQARYAAIRGTKGSYKGEATGSDKHYSFSIAEDPASDTVHVFESAIDLMSFATLQLFEGTNWRSNNMLSLAGVFKTKRTDVVPIALSQYLTDHPQVKSLHLHLDNDEIGRGAVAGIVAGLKGAYEVFDEPPACGKDYNEQLMMRVGLLKRKEAQVR